MHSIIIQSLWVTLMIMISIKIYAANFCVSNSTKFQAALSTAGSNAENDHIKLVGVSIP